VSSLAIACLLYFGLLLPVVVVGAWSWHRYSAPLLLDTLDADEMVVGAVHRLTTVTFTLLALGFAAAQAPSEHDLRHGIGAAVLSSWATVVFWLGAAHAAALWAFFRRRRRHEQAMMPPRVWAPAPPPAAPVYGPPFFAVPPSFGVPQNYVPPTFSQTLPPYNLPPYNLPPQTRAPYSG
jgi:hypothetical protein